MPIIVFACGKHSSKRFYRSAQLVPAYITCAECGEEMKKQLSAPSSESKVIVDNGFQARAVEVNPDIVQINKERSDKDYRTD